MNNRTALAENIRQHYNPASFLFTFQGTGVTRTKIIKSELAIPRGPGGKRQASVSFSSRSSKTLSCLLSSLDYSVPAAFLTLTHSSQYPFSPGRYKKLLLGQFARYLRQTNPEFSAVWRLEKQGNGEPHFHLLIFGFPSTLENFTRLQKAWAKTLRIPIPPRIDLRPIVSSTGAYLYLAGHHSKATQTWKGYEVGRYWGVLNRKKLPFSPARQAVLSAEADAVLARIFAKKEERRVAWFKSRGAVVEPRIWELANTVLFARDPWPLLERYCRRKKIRIFFKKNLDADLSHAILDNDE
jgi:hypothetical protein